MTQSEQTILFLGASQDQLHAIRTAKAMGLRTVTVDMNPASPGFALADDHAVVSTRDVPGLKAYVDSYRRNGKRIDGVCVMGSDIPQVVAALSQHLGTPHIPMEAALLSVHKLKMKERFAERGVPVPWFSQVASAADLREIVRKRGFPLVIKPTDRSGARGVFLLTERSDVEGFFARSKAESFAGEVMVEEYLPGLQISTETVMHKGKAHTPGFADRNYEHIDRFAPYIIENGGVVPSSVNRDTRCAVERLVEKAALALGVTDGIVKGDVVLTDDGPVMIEMATRLSGGDFSESLVPLGIGVNYVEAAIRIAVGDEPDLTALEPRFHQAVANRYFFPSSGRLERIEGVESVLENDWVKKLEFWYEPGQDIPPVLSHAHRFGVFVAVAPTVKELYRRVHWVYQTIRIVTRPDVPE